MKPFAKGSLQTMGVPFLLLTAYGLDSWRFSPAVRLPVELQQVTAGSLIGSVLPQVILAAVTLLLGWLLLIRSRPSVWVSLFYLLAGAYLLSYMPLLRIAMSSRGVVHEVLVKSYSPMIQQHLSLHSMQMRETAFAFLFAIGLFGMLRSFTSRRASNG